MPPYAIVMAIVLGLLVIWVIYISIWVLRIKKWGATKAAKVVTQHVAAMLSQHTTGPPDDWPPKKLDFP